MQQYIEKVQRSVVGDALLVLPLDFSEVCRKLKKGVMTSLSVLAESVVEACHEAGVEYGFAQPHIKRSILEQADVLSAELAEALKVLLSFPLTAFKQMQSTDFISSSHLQCSQIS